MDKTIRTAIAGSGKSARAFHIPLLKANPHFVIAKIFERTTDRMKTLCPDTLIVRNFEELLSDDIDLVLICTPNSSHYGLAKTALLAGKNVVVEKPFTVSSEEATELCGLAKKQKVLLSVYQNRRWDGDFRTAKKIIAAGLLGRVVDNEMHYDRYTVAKNPTPWKESGDPGTGVLYDLGVHIADQALNLFGMPAEVYADLRIQRENSLIVDNCFLSLSYTNGLRVVLRASQMAREPGPRLTVHGNLGSYVKYGIDLQEERLLAGELPVGAAWGREDREHWGILNTEISGCPIRCAVETERGDYPAYYRNIYEAITGQSPLLVTPEQARDVLLILEAAMKSSQTKNRVAV
jgi:predicted dehydrogenase